MNLLAVADFGTHSELFGRAFTKRPKVEYCSNSYLRRKTLSQIHVELRQKHELTKSRMRFTEKSKVTSIFLLPGYFDLNHEIFLRLSYCIISNILYPQLADNSHVPLNYI